MPTGYTCGVQDGTVTEFREFALQCARNFGACITMRDEPADAAIPDEFQPSTYHADALMEARDELATLERLTDDECRSRAMSDYAAALADWEAYVQRKAAERERYETMLAAARAWKPPTPEHQGLADFMVQQLVDSIEWDCGTLMKKPEILTGAEWRKQAIARAQWSVDYHKKHHAEELERMSGRNGWIKALRESL